MATVRPGSRTALLVVDVQVGVVHGAWQAERTVAQVAAAVAQARQHGVPVLWVQHADEDLVPGSADWAWAPPLQPAPGEPRLDKAHNSSFEQTTLEDELARLGVSHLLLAGCASNWCIRATAYGALERGYDLTLVSDAHTTRETPLPDGRTLDAAQVVADLNMTLRWLSYPGRRNAATPLAELSWPDRPAG